MNFTGINFSLKKTSVHIDIEIPPPPYGVTLVYELSVENRLGNATSRYGTRLCKCNNYCLIYIFLIARMSSVMSTKNS